MTGNIIIESNEINQKINVFHNNFDYLFRQQKHENANNFLSIYRLNNKFSGNI